MPLDSVLAVRDSFRKRRYTAFAFLFAAGVFCLSYIMCIRESAYQFVDFQVHMLIAADFDFADLHSITSRLAYPLWHLIVSTLYQIGLPIAVSASLVTALCKAVLFLEVYALIRACTSDEVPHGIILAVSTFLMIVTGIWIPSVSRHVYQGVGSPTVWHNPTQQIVTAAMMLVIPWLCHCWYEFEKALENQRDRFTLPAWKVLVLAVLLMASLACKPTFMQALLPAAFVLFFCELVRYPKYWRYFLQIVLAFLPAAAYFLLQYLYYTGVVVEYTSGVEIGITPGTAWIAVRNALMMSACPLAALILCRKKNMFKNKALLLAVLMVAFSALEAMAFRETGLREGHGNFTWAADSSSFWLWVCTVPVFLESVKADLKNSVSAFKKAGYGAVGILFLWHLVSSVYYLFYLFSTENAF